VIERFFLQLSDTWILSQFLNLKFDDYHTEERCTIASRERERRTVSGPTSNISLGASDMSDIDAASSKVELEDANASRRGMETNLGRDCNFSTMEST
jgi:hypothetical protein